MRLAALLLVGLLCGPLAQVLIVGYVAYRRGRKASRPPLTWGGVALMAYPIAISETWQLWAIGAALCGWVYAKWN